MIFSLQTTPSLISLFLPQARTGPKRINIFLAAGIYSSLHTIATSVVIRGNHAGGPGNSTLRGFDESVFSGAFSLMQRLRSMELQLLALIQ